MIMVDNTSTEQLTHTRLNKRVSVVTIVLQISGGGSHLRLHVSCLGGGVHAPPGAIEGRTGLEGVGEP